MALICLCITLQCTTCKPKRIQQQVQDATNQSSICATNVTHRCVEQWLLSWPGLLNRSVTSSQGCQKPRGPSKKFPWQVDPTTNWSYVFWSIRISEIMELFNLNVLFQKDVANCQIVPNPKKNGHGLQKLYLILHDCFYWIQLWVIFLLEKQLFSEANFRTLRLQLLDLGLCL